MVVSIKDHKIYALDTFPAEAKLASRPKNMVIAVGLLPYSQR